MKNIPALILRLHAAMILSLLLLLSSCAVATPSISEDDLECANLGSWTLRDDGVIEFTVREDSNAPGEWRWYYFRLTADPGEVVNFEISNAATASAAGAWSFNQPVFSADEGQTWDRITEASFRSGVFRFTHTAQSSGDLIALAPVYTYTRVGELIEKWKTNPRVVSVDTIANSREDRPVNRLIITGEPTADPKPIIWVIARQHPSETAGSFKCEGLVEWLLSDAPEAAELLADYEFHVVPCINPDGVVRGNYRRNEAGLNLNRVWENPDPVTAPSIYGLQQVIREQKTEGRKFALFFDLHGHSTLRKNFFFYNEPLFDDESAKEETEALMQIFEKVNPDFTFAQSDSSDPSETGVAKNWAYVELGIPAVTFESTYQDINYGPHKGEYMTVDRYTALGRDLGVSIYKILIENKKATSEEHIEAAEVVK